MVIQFQFSYTLVLTIAFAVFGCAKTSEKVVGNNLLLTSSVAFDEYDFSCLKSSETEGSDDIIEMLGKMKDAGVDAQNESVSLEEEQKIGDEMYGEVLKQMPLRPQHRQAEFLEGLMYMMLRVRQHPCGLRFKISCVQSDVVNAFTAGGQIFVTTALLDGAESIDELACVIGHEIAHNELGHIREKLKEHKLAREYFGDDLGSTLFSGFQTLTISFNQRKEAEADLMGIDLALLAGFNPCAGIQFWNRMQNLEGEQTDVGNLQRSHPYSTRRADCYRSHLSTHHKIGCE